MKKVWKLFMALMIFALFGMTALAAEETGTEYIQVTFHADNMGKFVRHIDNETEEEIGEIYTIEVEKGTKFGEIKEKLEQEVTLVSSNEKYEFDCWRAKDLSDNFTIEVSDELPVNVNGEVRAVWKEKTICIEINLQNPEQEGNEQFDKIVESVNYGTKLNDFLDKIGEIEEYKNKYENYIFQSWYVVNSNEDGEYNEVEIDDDYSVSNIDGTLKIYAKWIGKDCKITFYTDNEDEVYGTKTVKYGEKYNEFPNQPMKMNYIFDGWYLEPQASEGESIKITEEDIVKGDIALYAHWAGVKHEISFAGEGISVPLKSIEVEFGGTYPYQSELPLLKREGYTFEGWFFAAIDEIGKLQYTMVDGQKVEKTVNECIYALWKKAEVNPEPEPKPEPKPDTKPVEKTLGEIKNLKIVREGFSNVNITLNPVENAERYEIWFSEKKNSGYKKIGTSINTTIGLKSKLKLKAGASGYFKVKALKGTQSKEVIKKFTYAPKKLKLTKKKKGKYVRLYWGKLKENIAGLEIRKNGKKYASTEKGKPRFYDLAQKNAQKGSAFKMRVWFKNGKKKIYSPWSNTVKM